MSFLAALPIVGKLIGGPVEAIIDKMGEEDRREFEAAMSRLEGEMLIMQSQIEVNRAEASHPSIFVAGWRPFIGWACGLILVASAGVAIFGSIVGMSPDQVAALGEARAMMMPILMGLLGLGGMRTFEKFKGVARERIR